MQVAEGGKEGYKKEGKRLFLDMSGRGGKGGKREKASSTYGQEKRPACPPRMVGWLGGWSLPWQSLVWEGMGGKSLEGGRMHRYA